MPFLWRRNKSNPLTNYGNPSPTDQDIGAGFAQNLHNSGNRLSMLKRSIPISIEGTLLSAFLSRRLRAGMTVEAAVVLPVVLLFLLNLSCAIEMIRLHGNLQMALWETGHMLAIYGHALGEEEALGSVEAEDGDPWWKEMAGIAFSYTYIKNRIVDYLGEDYLESSPLTHGTAGLQFWESEVLRYNDEMEITVTYGVSPWCSLVGFLPFRMANRYYAHIWNGYDIMAGFEGKDEALATVYVTETGSVYHRDRDCSHLRLSIREIIAGTEGMYRNENGGKYSECVKCRKEENTGILYIAREGNSFHYSKVCSGLKRTVFSLLLKDADAYRPCSRCGNVSRPGF